MNILFLTQVVPYPLDAGPKIRAYYVLRHLIEAGHEVTLVTFTRDSDPPAALDHLSQLCHAVHSVPMPRSIVRDVRAWVTSLWTGTPFLIARDQVVDMDRTITACLPAVVPDVVHADQLWMAPYALRAAAAARSPRRPATVLDQHNAVFQIPRRLALGTRNPVKRAVLALETSRLTRYELATCAQFDHVVWVTDEDRAAFESARQAAGGDAADGPLPPFTTIPICVDVAGTPPLARESGGRRVTFLGGMHWPPNAEGIRWFAHEVWPAVRAAVPDAVLTVIGKRPPGGLVGTADGLDIRGAVDDPESLLRATAAFIVPLHAGGGMRVKIADAWRWGVPVVTTTIGAEGTAVRDGINALVADTPAAFANAVIRLLTDPALGQRLALAGRTTASEHYDWRTVYAAWDDVYSDVTKPVTLPARLGPVESVP